LAACKSEVSAAMAELPNFEVNNAEDVLKKKSRRATKERLRVKKNSLAFENLARTLDLYPSNKSQKKPTYEQILVASNEKIKDMIQEISYLRRMLPQVNYCQHVSIAMQL